MKIDYTFKASIEAEGDTLQIITCRVPLEEVEDDNSIYAILELHLESYMQDNYCGCSFNESQNHCDCGGGGDFEVIEITDRTLVEQPKQKALTVQVPNEYTNINQEAFDEWMFYKKYKNKGAITKTLNMLNRHDYQTQQEMVDKSIMNEYKGLFEPKQKRSRTDNNVNVANSWLEENDFLDTKFIGGDC